MKVFLRIALRALLAGSLVHQLACLPVSNSPKPASEKTCFRAQDLHGKQLCLEEANRCPILVKLMASWCDTCTLEMQSFEKAFQHLPSDSRPPVLVLGVMDSEEALLAYTKHVHSPFIFGLDSEGFYQSKLALMAIPGTAIMDKDGNMIEFDDPFSGSKTNLLSGPRDWNLEKATKFLKEVCSLASRGSEPGNSRAPLP